MTASCPCSCLGCCYLAGWSPAAWQLTDQLTPPSPRCCCCCAAWSLCRSTPSSTWPYAWLRCFVMTAANSSCLGHMKTAANGNWLALEHHRQRSTSGKSRIFLHSIFVLLYLVSYFFNGAFYFWIVDQTRDDSTRQMLKKIEIVNIWPRFRFQA